MPRSAVKGLSTGIELTIIREPEDEKGPPWYVYLEGDVKKLVLKTDSLEAAKKTYADLQKHYAERAEKGT